jgi:hypothetical protein
MSMSELEVIERALKRAARRRRMARALAGMWRGLFLGGLVALLILAAYKLLPLSPWSPAWAAAAPLIGIVLGAVAGAWRGSTMAETARWVDLRQGLKERLSTALEIAAKPDSGEWRALLIADAVEHAKLVDPRSVVSFGMHRAGRWALPVLTLAAILTFIPEYRSKAHIQKQNDATTIKDVGRQLADLTRRNLEKRPPALDQTAQSMEAVAATGDHLAKANLSRAEALSELANVAEKLKDEINQLSQNPDLRRLEQTMRSGSGRDSQSVSDVQRHMEALQKQLGSENANPQAIGKLQKELEKLREAAKAQTGKNASEGDADRQNLSAALSALSSQMGEMGMQLPALEAAIEALAANNTELFLKDLEVSMTDLEKMRDMAQSLQQMRQQMEKLGKDLAEQLQNAQPEAAHSTLQKMMQQLNSANLSPEQMKQMMEEVSKAVDPAGKYGDVAKHLNNAAANMKSGSKTQASQDLAKAAKELEDLMKQMGDAQALMAELETLNRASMCIANGQGWGQCNKPGFGQKSGNRPGSGVGTWADSANGSWDGNLTDGWDNSGIVRPDMDSRGLTERDPSLNSALSPTKVKGQFSPGGQMPSITLKGVSIKGQSSVEYEAAAAAAQSDAESALSQEKVPRAYQGAVRDYFDDLKK